MTAYKPKSDWLLFMDRAIAAHTLRTAMALHQVASELIAPPVAGNPPKHPPNKSIWHNSNKDMGAKYS